jgi:hypothetical protein
VVKLASQEVHEKLKALEKKNSPLLKTLVGGPNMMNFPFWVLVYNYKVK